MLSPLLIRNIRLFEWLFIGIHALLALSSGENRLALSNILIYTSFFSLSLYFPQGHSHWRRSLYICAGLLLAILGNFINVSTDLLISLYLGKSCFLLDRKETFAAIALTGVGWGWSELASSANASGDIIFDPIYHLPHYQVPIILGTSLGIYFVGSIFVVSLCFTILAEQKSRKRAEDLLQQVETLAKDLERSRIARDIHDSLGHTLTNLNIQLQLAQKLRQNDLDKAFQSIDLAQTLSIQCIEDVSFAVASLRKVDFDLNQAINHLVEQLRCNMPIEARVKITLPLLPPSMRHQIYLILKECLFNVKKHSQASQICLRGCVTQSSLQLDLEDNGVGFIPKQLTTGFGLKGISERIQMLGGSLNIDSTLGQGTLIQITIPL